MFCRFCGAKISDDSIFCNNCGAKLVKEAEGECDKKNQAPHKISISDIWIWLLSITPLVAVALSMVIFNEKRTTPLMRLDLFITLCFSVAFLFFDYIVLWKAGFSQWFITTNKDGVIYTNTVPLYESWAGISFIPLIVLLFREIRANRRLSPGIIWGIILSVSLLSCLFGFVYGILIIPIYMIYREAKTNWNFSPAIIWISLLFTNVVIIST